MDDVENDEDLQDLEARLYAQVHHESAGQEFAAQKFEQPSRLVTSSSVINKTTGNVPRGRYWTNNQSPMASQHRKFSNEKSAGDSRPKFEATASTSSAFAESAPPLVNALKRNTSSPASTGVTHEASGGDPEIKRSPNPLNVKNIAKKSVSVAKEAQESEGATGSGNNSGNWMNRKLNKLNRNKKLQQKKAKAKQAREKQKPPAAVETIVLDFSDDNEDVIEIPVTPPPILTIDSSDDETLDVGSFAEPNDVKHKESKQGGSRSLCNSPSSIMMDDFIGQQDKSRLLTEVSAADDEDLQCIEGTGVDDSPPRNAGQVDSSKQPPDFVTPKKRVSNSSKTKKSTYEVTQSNFRAVDVYESESSDMPESVYGKGGERNISSVTNKSSSSDVEEIEIMPKTKKVFRKRKASGSCRGSEPNDDSTDSENLKAKDPVLSLISRGEAVENCKQKPKKRQQRLDVNSSDNEFINKLANIVHGDLDESRESNHSAEETITARDIAEDVLNQGQESIADIERDKAVPNTTATELDNVLNFIDNLDTSYHAIKEQSRPRALIPEIMDEVHRVESPDLDVEITGDNLEEAAPPAEPEKGDPEINTVFSNRDHVAWTEEMVRFYENSWGEENFDIDRIMRTMDRTANWRIRNTDRFPRKGKYSNVKCNNCSEYGHMRARCPQPKKDLICSMCGDIGHREPRCPNTICLRCGRKWNIFTRTCSACVTNNRLICPVCKIRGHGIDSCPDKWRRYHSTTAINDHPNQKLFYNERKACCICGCFGHLPERCRSSNKLTEYLTPLSEIRSHAKSYEDVAVKNPLPAGVVGVNLMCEPNDKILFPFTTKVNRSQCYGRFISAVGLLYNRKRPAIGQNVKVKKKKSKKNYVLNPFATNFSLSDEIHDAGDVHDVVTEVFVNIDKNKLNTTEPIELVEEATFKSPNDLPESNTKSDSNVEKKTEGVKLIFKNHKLIDEVAVDSDSNYSFSEHFSFDKTTESSTPQKSKGREVGPLPDFIPLVDSDDEEEIDINEAALPGTKGPISGIKLNIDCNQDEEEVEEICEGKIYLNEFHTNFLTSPVGRKFLDENSKKHDVEASVDTNTLRSVLIIKAYPSNQESFHTELMDKIKKLSGQEEICEAKIYLNKFHSKFLLSPNGSKFLIETSKNHDVKAIVEWTAVGNVLIIEGLPSNQDGFHSDLMQAIKKLSDDLNRKELDQSTKVPRKREALIKFVQESFLLLEKDIGNPYEFYERIKSKETEINKSSFKTVERSRRQLNIILMGQGGLRDGHMHLYALQKNLKMLLNDDDSMHEVSNELRDEINGHWKYIFSSYPHENYDQLIRQYFELKKFNRLPKLNLDSRLLGKKQLDTTFTKEQKDLLMEPPSIIPKQSEKSKMVINPMSLSQSDMMPIELSLPQTQESHEVKNSQEQNNPNDQTAGLHMFQNQLQQQENQLYQSRNQLQRQNCQQNLQQRNRSQFQSQNRQRQQHQNRQHEHPNRQQQHRNRQQNRYQQQQQNRHQQQQQNRHQQQQQNRQQFPPQTQQSRPHQFNQQQPSRSGRDGQSFAPEKIREINKKWVSQAEVLMNQMTKSSPPKESKNSSSPRWSRECMKYIVQCRNKCGSNPLVVEKLNMLTERASKNLLSLNDFKALQRIYFNVLKNIGEA